MAFVKRVAVPWTLRAQPAVDPETGIVFRAGGSPKRRVEVLLFPDDYRLFVTLRDRLFDRERQEFLLDGEEREAALNELHVLMEMWHLVAAELMPGEMPERVSSTETLALMEDMEGRGFKIPAAAKEQMAVGQTSLLAEPRPPSVPPRMPYRDDDGLRDDPDPPAWSTPSATSAPESRAAMLPDFDGETYVRALDHERLGKQLLRVGKLMADGGWHTLAEIAAATEDPEASVSARLRDLRKGKFGGHTVNRERVDGRASYRYRLVLDHLAQPWGDEEVAA